MLRQDERRHFLVRREHVADFHAQDFETQSFGATTFISSNCVDLRQLRAHCTTRICAASRLFSCASAALPGALGFARRNGLLREQFLLTLGIGAHEFELGFKSLGIAAWRCRSGPARVRVAPAFPGRRVVPAVVRCCKASPSCAKIFSTRPPVRGATWTSSTSIVPETGWMRGRQAASEDRTEGRRAATRRKASTFARREKVTNFLRKRKVWEAGSKLTMKTRRFDHIDLRVKDMAVAKDFTRSYCRRWVFPSIRAATSGPSGRRPGEGPVEFFGFTEETKHQPNENRIAFWAESRAEVDRLDRDRSAERRIESGGAGVVAANIRPVTTRFSSRIRAETSSRFAAGRACRLEIAGGSARRIEMSTAAPIQKICDRSGGSVTSRSSRFSRSCRALILLGIGISLLFLHSRTRWLERISRLGRWRADGGAQPGDALSS